MGVLSEKDASTFSVSFILISWAINFLASMAGLFISLYLYISHDDMQVGIMEPAELCNNISSVSLVMNICIVRTLGIFGIISIYPIGCF